MGTVKLLPRVPQAICHPQAFQAVFLEGPSKPLIVTVAISDATACVQPVDAHLGAENSSVQTQADQAASFWCCQSVCQKQTER